MKFTVCICSTNSSRENCAGISIEYQISCFPYFDDANLASMHVQNAQDLSFNFHPGKKWIYEFMTMNNESTHSFLKNNKNQHYLHYCKRDLEFYPHIEYIKCMGCVTIVRNLLEYFKIHLCSSTRYIILLKYLLLHKIIIRKQVRYLYERKTWNGKKIKNNLSIFIVICLLQRCLLTVAR